MSEAIKIKLRTRMSQVDAHYAGNLVDGARILALFGDAATEVLIRHDGDEGLFRAYETVEFLAPVYAGDYLEVTATLKKVGNTSREIEFEAYKVIEAVLGAQHASAAQVLEKPLRVAQARGTCVVPLECQRIKRK